MTWEVWLRPGVEAAQVWFGANIWRKAVATVIGVMVTGNKGKAPPPARPWYSTSTNPRAGSINPLSRVNASSPSSPKTVALEPGAGVNLQQSTASAGGLSETPITDPSRLLKGSENLADHHLMPRKYERWFNSKGISDIDEFTVTVDHNVTHLKAIHGKGNMGQMPGKWNQMWADFIESKEGANATTKDVYQQLGKMMDQYDLNNLKIHPYGQ